MHDDSRTNLAIALTAAQYGATMANYCEVTDLLHESPEGTGKVTGARVCDKLTGKGMYIHTFIHMLD